MRDIERKVSEVQRMKRNRHDRLVIDIAERLVDSPVRYEQMQLKYEYGHNGNGAIGEIDVWAQHGKNILIFEIKSSDSQRNYLKAVSQLQRAEKYFGNHKTYLFYVTPNKLERVNGRSGKQS